MVYYQGGNGSKNYLTKKASQPRGNLVVKKKKKKTDFKRKNMTITYSAKMTLKSS